MSELQGRRALLERQPWLTFLLPLIVFMFAGTLEPTPETLGGEAIGLNIPYSYYPLLYTLKIALTVAAACFVWPGYRQFPLRISPLAVVVGVVGVFIWVGLCQLQVEQKYLVPALEAIYMDGFIPSGARSSFNPLEEMASAPGLAWGFLAVRFFGLVAVVPLIEELFLRGFVMRFVIQADWWAVPFGKVSGMALVLGTLVPMAMHPGELLAAAVWFSMITWLMVRTRNIWDCVIAHAITNLLLGIYVVWSGHWELM
jgi:membrane protease YdiL (CAAX protease family)